jgi:hypothetical protein
MITRLGAAGERWTRKGPKVPWYFLAVRPLSSNGISHGSVALKRTRRSTLRLLRVGVGVGALVVLIGAGVANMLYRSCLLLSESRPWSALDPLESRRLASGAAYTDAIESIRRALPRDAWYLLVPDKVSPATGWEFWVRYDLAPRRPILIQPRAGRGLRGPNGGAIPKRVRWAVMPDDDGVPRLLTREETLARLRAHVGR